jgi:hypothetical protein
MHASPARFNDWGSIACFALFGSFLSAVIFMMVLRHNLPPTDLMRKEPIVAFIMDPFALMMWIPITMLSAGVMLPVAFIGLRRADLMKSFLLVMLIVAAEILVVTPIHPVHGWLGAYPATAAALLLCRVFLPLRRA